MTDDSSWADRLAGAARNALVTAETAAIIASSPASTLQDTNLQLVDPTNNAAITTLAESHDALSSVVEGRSKADELVEETDVTTPQSTSLIVDAPSWFSSPTDLEDSINEDLGSLSDIADNSDFGNTGSEFSGPGADL